MDELENFKPQKQLAHIMSLDSNVSAQQNTPILYSDIKRSDYGAENGYDLESGIEVTEPEAPFAQKLLGRVGYSRLSLIQGINSSVGVHLGNDAIQCESVQGKESEMRFVFHHNALKDSTVPVVAEQSQGIGLAKAVDRDKSRHDNDNTTLKPSWKKPPRPPSRAATNALREKDMKGISDTALLLRRAKLQRMRSMRKHKFTKPSSVKTGFWALLVTIFFCVIMIIQGIFSGGTGGSQGSSPISGQTIQVAVQDFASHASNNGSGQPILDQLSVPPPIQFQEITSLQIFSQMQPTEVHHNSLL